MTKSTASATLVMRRVEPDELAPEAPDRVTRVVSWIGWHFWELAGVVVPAAVAVAVSPWAWVVSGAVSAGWTVHSVRTAREQAAIRSGRDLPPAAIEPDPVHESGVDIVSEVVSEADATDVGPVPNPAGVWL